MARRHWSVSNLSADEVGTGHSSGMQQGVDADGCSCIMCSTGHLCSPPTGRDECRIARLRLGRIPIPHDRHRDSAEADGEVRPVAVCILEEPASRIRIPLIALRPLPPSKRRCGNAAFACAERGERADPLHPRCVATAPQACRRPDGETRMVDGSGCATCAPLEGAMWRATAPLGFPSRASDVCGVHGVRLRAPLVRHSNNVSGATRCANHGLSSINFRLPCGCGGVLGIAAMGVSTFGRWSRCSRTRTSRMARCATL